MTKVSTAAPRMLTVADIAEQLQVSTKTVQRAIKAGELHVHHIGRLPRVAEDDLMLFIAKRRR